MKKRIFIGLIPLLLSGAVSCYGNSDIQEEKKDDEKKEEPGLEIKQFVITWKDYNGEILATSTVKENVVPTYPKSTPTREETEEATYEFKGWEPALKAATSNTTYTATYTETIKEVEIEDGFFATGSDDFHVSFEDMVTNNTISIERNDDGIIITDQNISQYNKEGKLVIPRKYNNETIISIGDTFITSNKGGSLLKEIVFPNTLKSIGSEAMIETGLTTLTLPSSLEICGYNAFTDNTDLRRVDILCPYCNFGQDQEDEQEVDAGSIFYGCSSLEQVNFPEGMSYIGNGMFYDCVSLNNISFPSTMKTISSNAFIGCESLTSINLDGIENLGESAFEYTGLTSVTLPSSLKYCSNAFNSCESLEYAIIKPASTTLTIKINAFSDSNISTIYYEGTQEQFSSKVVIEEYVGTYPGDTPSSPLINSENEDDNIEILYYSQTSQEGSWHYDNDNQPVRW